MRWCRSFFLRKSLGTFLTQHFLLRLLVLVTSFLCTRTYIRKREYIHTRHTSKVSAIILHSCLFFYSFFFTACTASLTFITIPMAISPLPDVYSKPQLQILVSSHFHIHNHCRTFVSVSTTSTVAWISNNYHSLSKSYSTLLSLMITATRINKWHRSFRLQWKTIVVYYFH